MKKVIYICLMLLCSMPMHLKAQKAPQTYMKQAQECVAANDYTRARNLYLQAYHSLADKEQYDLATACGVEAAGLYHKEHLYKEAFDLLRDVDHLIASAEQKSHKTRPDLRYTTVKERLRMYTKLKNTARIKEQMTRMEEMAKAAQLDSLNNDLLYTQANLYYALGMNGKADEAINRLIGKYKSAKAYDKVSECYRTLIDIARKNGNAGLTARSYEEYMAWTDSARTLKAQDETAALQKICTEKQATIDEKEELLQERGQVIAGMGVLSAILFGVLALGAIVLVRFIVLTRKQKKAIAEADERNRLKNGFIRNISAQMCPTLDKLDGTVPAVSALKGFVNHIDRLTDLENHLDEGCEMQEQDMGVLCNEMMKRIEGKTQPDVTRSVNAPKLRVPVCTELLEQVLGHLLDNAAIYTPAGGRITLEFKKRGAHTHQFIVSNTGKAIEDGLREHLFKPFTEVKDLTQGDGLGLPICALMATRMKGTLTLDEGYTKGARFILELHA